MVKSYQNSNLTNFSKPTYHPERRSREDPKFKSSPAKSQSSEHSNHASVTESKIYQTEDEMVNFLLDEIKEESSNITIEDTGRA